MRPVINVIVIRQQKTRKTQKLAKKFLKIRKIQGMKNTNYELKRIIICALSQVMETVIKETKW